MKRQGDDLMKSAQAEINQTTKNVSDEMNKVSKRFDGATDDLIEKVEKSVGDKIITISRATKEFLTGLKELSGVIERFSGDLSDTRKEVVDLKGELSGSLEKLTDAYAPIQQAGGSALLNDRKGSTKNYGNVRGYHQ